MSSENEPTRNEADENTQTEAAELTQSQDQKTADTQTSDTQIPAAASTDAGADSMPVNETTDSAGENNAEASSAETPSAVDPAPPENADSVESSDETPPASEVLTSSDDDEDEDDWEDDDLDEESNDSDPIEDIADDPDEEVEKRWYILKVQVNRETSICDALTRRVKMHGLENHFGEILVPTEDVKEFTKTGKQRIVKRKLYPGYIVVNMSINDDTWFIVRETPGIGDFTGSAGKPAPLEANEVDRIIRLSKPQEAEEGDTKTPRSAFPYKVGDRVRVNEGNFQNLEGDVESIDESNGRITVILNMFGRATPVQLNHWQVEKI